MSEYLIVLAAAAAAVYLLLPFSRQGRGRWFLALLPALLVASPPPARAMQTDPSIGLLLIAVDAQRDHLRISEAMRLVNAGPPRDVELVIVLPAGATYLTFHRGLETPRRDPFGFRDRLHLGRGARELVYSYAVPAGRTHTLVRRYPLPVSRLELVVRGSGVQLTASPGRQGPPLIVGPDRLPRWEATGLDAGRGLTVTLRGLPAGRPWLPRAAAGGLTVVLAVGLAIAARRPVSAPMRQVEESSAARRT